MKRLLVLALALVAALPPAAASAGTYHVYSCAAGGRTFPNNAWKSGGDILGVVEDTDCTTGAIGLGVPANTRMNDNTSSALTFTSPPGTTIADFTLSRSL